MTMFFILQLCFEDPAGSDRQFLVSLTGRNGPADHLQVRNVSLYL